MNVGILASNSFTGLSYGRSKIFFVCSLSSFIFISAALNTNQIPRIASRARSSAVVQASDWPPNVGGGGNTTSNAVVANHVQHEPEEHTRDPNNATSTGSAGGNVTTESRGGGGVAATQASGHVGRSRELMRGSTASKCLYSE